MSYSYFFPWDDWSMNRKHRKHIKIHMNMASSTASFGLTMTMTLKAFLGAAKTCYREIESRAALAASTVFSSPTINNKSCVVISGGASSSNITPSTTTSTSTSIFSSSNPSSSPSSILTSHAGGTTVCIGNEAGDADSIISAICLAYLKSMVKNESESSISFFPFTQLDRKQITLLPDVNILLSSRGLHFDDLMCLDDSLIFNESGNGCANWDYLFRSSKLILLDHNTISNRLKSVYKNGNIISAVDDMVVEILDHHLDLGQHLISCTGNDRRIAFDAASNKALVGSSCTLVYEYYSYHVKPLDIPLDVDVAHLLLGVILLDTFNMDEKTARGSARDLTAIQYLMGICNYDKSRCDELFISLRDAKMDPVFWRGLQASDALSMDYKDFNVESKGIIVGMSSICMPLNLFLQKQTSLGAICEYFISDSKRKVMIIMCLFQDESSQETRREILISSKEDIKHEELIDQLRQKGLGLKDTLLLDPLTLEEQIDFEIKKMKAENNFSFGCFTRCNPTYSRKQVAPMIQDILNSL